MTPQKKLIRAWEFAGCEFNESTRELLVGGELKELETKPLEVLRQLLLHPREVVSQEELFDAVWTGFARSESLQKSLFTAISKLRKVLPEINPPIIATVPKFGYRLGVPVVERLVDNGPRNTLNLQPGDAVPGRENWRVTEQLPGSFSEVWIAKHVKTPEMRVFKFALNSDQLEGLKREVTLSRYFVEALPNPDQFVRVLDWDFEMEPFLLESAYGGLSLPKWFENRGGIEGISLGVRLAIIESVANSVAAAHGLGVLHKDLKPSNILLSGTDPSDWRIKVADFGSAALDSADRLQSFHITNLGFPSAGDSSNGGGGTWTYTAPEIREGGAPTVAADVYALGVMLYQIIVGDLGRQLTVGWETGVDDPLLREDIKRAAEGNPVKRLSSAAELAQRISSLEERRRVLSAADADAERALLNEQHLMAIRAKRPWVTALICVLMVASCTVYFLYRRASLQRDVADARSADLLAMNDFLSKDLISQSNPFLQSSKDGPPQQETLLEAIERATPQIDRRFGKAPQVAARLHETVAGALDARTDFSAAAQQYKVAAQQFRNAEGSLSQNAIIAELMRENTQIRSQMPASIKEAQEGFKQQQALIRQIHNLTPELQARAALSETASMAYGAHPEQALPLLKKALQRAESKPDFDPLLLNTLKVRFSAIYLRLNDGKNAERAARDSIASISSIYGPDSSLMLEPYMALAEALFLEGNFKAALAQTSKNYELFTRTLGSENQLTIGALYMKAAAEGALEQYDDAIRDDLAVYTTEHSNPSGRYIQEDSLATAASFECHSGQLAKGIADAQQVMRESGPDATNQAYFVNISKYTIADCLISQDEAKASTSRSRNVIDQSENLLNTINVSLVSQAAGSTDFEGLMDLARARIAFLEGNFELAKNYVGKATPFVDKPGGGMYEKSLLNRLRNNLH